MLGGSRRGGMLLASEAGRAHGDHHQEAQSELFCGEGSHSSWWPASSPRSSSAGHTDSAHTRKHGNKRKKQKQNQTSPLLRTRTATHVRQNNHLGTRTSNKESWLKSADPLPAARDSAQLNPPLASHRGVNWFISGKSNHSSVSLPHSSSPYIHTAFESSREVPLPLHLHHLKQIDFRFPLQSEPRI